MGYYWSEMRSDKEYEEEKKRKVEFCKEELHKMKVAFLQIINSDIDSLSNDQIIEYYNDIERAIKYIT